MLDILNKVISYMAILIIFLWVSVYFITTRYIEKQQSGIIFDNRYQKLSKYIIFLPSLYKTKKYCKIIFFKRLRNNSELCSKYFVEDFMQFIRPKDKINAALLCIIKYIFLALLLVKLVIDMYLVIQYEV